jgi:hypothetical protein
LKQNILFFQYDLSRYSLYLFFLFEKKTREKGCRCYRGYSTTFSFSK